MRRTAYGVWLAVIIAAGYGAAARAEHHADGVSFEQLYAEPTRIPGYQMRFFWTPQYPPGTVHYVVNAICTRRDGGAEFGSNRVALKQFRLTGLDSGTLVDLAALEGQLERGRILLDAVVPEAATVAGDSTVLVEVKVAFRNEVEGVLACRLDFYESEELPIR